MLILPFIEQDDLHKRYSFNEPWDGPNNRALAERMPKIYSLHCVHTRGATIANYLAIVGSETVWRPGKPTSFGDIKDGPSNTILIPENYGMNIHWMEPRDLEFDTMDWTIDNPIGISSKYNLPAAVFVDGSVRTLSKKFTPEALRALATIAGGDSADQNGVFAVEISDGRDRPVTKP
jgi:hypothetical protein